MSKYKKGQKKKSIKTMSLVSLMFLSIVINAANVTHADTLNVCYDHWAPMTIFPSKESPERGIIIDMLDHIYTSKGYQITYYEVPLARGLDMVTEGLCDMLPEYLFSPNTEKHFVYAEAVTYKYTAAFVVRKNDTWHYSGVDSIKGKRIATGPGWDYSSMSTDYQKYLDNPKNANLVEVIAGYDDIIDRIFRMIKDNRIDLYADNELVLQHILNKLKFNNDLKIIYPGLENKLIERPIFSKNIPAKKRDKLIKIWNNGRKSIKGDFETKLLKKYNITFKD
ncbi:substrate-binding periplasmic protein [Pseudomonas sp. HK3]